MNVRLIEIQHDWTDGETRYWFDVDGVEYAIEDIAGNQTLVDVCGDDVLDHNLESKLKELVDIITDALSEQGSDTLLIKDGKYQIGD